MTRRIFSSVLLALCIIVPSIASAQSVGSGCPVITRTLQRGMQGKDISALQSFLALDPSIYPEGLVTGYFGPATEKAIQRFQTKGGIVSSGTPSTTGFGAVGPRTRGLIQQICERVIGSSGNLTVKSATFTAYPVVGAAPLNVRFSAAFPTSKPSNYVVQFGDGTSMSISSTQQGVCTQGEGSVCRYYYGFEMTHTYAPGTYTASLIPQVDCAADPQCQNLSPITIGSVTVTVAAGSEVFFTVPGSITIAKGGSARYLNPPSDLLIRVVDIESAPASGGALPLPSAVYVSVQNVPTCSSGMSPCPGATSSAPVRLAVGQQTKLGNYGVTLSALTIQNATFEVGGAAATPGVAASFVVKKPTVGQKVASGSVLQISWEATGAPTGAFAELDLMSVASIPMGVIARAQSTSGTFVWSIPLPKSASTECDPLVDAASCIGQIAGGSSSCDISNSVCTVPEGTYYIVAKLYTMSGSARTYFATAQSEVFTIEKAVPKTAATTTAETGIGSGFCATLLGFVVQNGGIVPRTQINSGFQDTFPYTPVGKCENGTWKYYWPGYCGSQKCISFAYKADSGVVANDVANTSQKCGIGMIEVGSPVSGIQYCRPDALPFPDGKNACKTPDGKRTIAKTFDAYTPQQYDPVEDKYSYVVPAVPYFSGTTNSGPSRMPAMACLPGGEWVQVGYCGEGGVVCR